MFARLPLIRKIATRLIALFSVLWLAACDIAPIAGGSSPKVDTSRPVPVALLVPGGAQDAGDNRLAKSLENAARMAVADLQGAKIDLRVYNTAGNAQQAAVVARRAVDEGAKIILGPLHREAAVAASTAVANDGVSVLSFSNTSTIAGGNLFLLGQLYDTTARRLAGFAAQNGVTRYYVAAAEGPGGDLSRRAAVNAVAAAGGQIVGSHSYPLSQQDIMNATTTIAAQAKAAGAQAIILAAQPGAELAILGTMLPEQGISAPGTRFIGLTRWNSAPEMLELKGLEGGYFALPDTGRQRGFEARYASVYGDKPLLPHITSLAYDGVAAIGALLATGSPDALSPQSLTRRSGFQGTSGIFRLLRNGLNERGLAVATIENGQVRVLSPAPATFGNATN